MPVTKIVGWKPAEDDIGPCLNRHVLHLRRRQMQVFKMGLPVLACIHPYNHNLFPPLTTQGAPQYAES